MQAEFLIKLIGVWLGVLARMTIPFWRKLYKGKTIKFNFKYLRRTLASLVLSTIFTILIFPKLETTGEGAVNFESAFKLFSLSFGFGFGFNSLLLEFASWFEKK
jgi:hypothetical protein